MPLLVDAIAMEIDEGADGYVRAVKDSHGELGGR